MNIKQRLIFNAGFIVVALIAIVLIFRGAFNSVINLQQAATLTSDLNKSMLSLRRHEKDFMARKDLKYQAKFKKNIDTMKSDIDRLDQTFADFDMPSQGIKSLTTIFSEYQSQFFQFIEQRQVIGLTSEDGKLLALGTTAYDVESLLDKSNNFEISARFNRLRIIEKSFLQKTQPEYIDRFNSQAQTVSNLIDQVELSSQSQLRSAFRDYVTAFDELSEAFTVLGLDHKSGLHGKLRSTVHKAETVFDKTSQSVLAALHDKETSIFAKAAVTVLGLAIFVIATSGWIAHSIIKPLREVEETAKDIVDTSDLSKRVKVHGAEELQRTANSVNAIVEHSQNVIAKVFDSSIELNAATQALNDNISRTNEDMLRQHQEADMVATAVTEMGATISEIAQNTEAAAENARASSEKAIRGQEEVKATVDRVTHLSQKLIESSESVSLLAKESESIGSVLSVIRGIAEQTNLLALNAAIEAARAGEHGRGFAVVADEVRNLAMKTQESTEEIANIVQSLQNKTQEIVEEVNNCKDEGLSSAEKANQAGEILVQIVSDVSHIEDMSTQIAAAIEEQSTVSAEVHQNVIAIRDITEQTTSLCSENSESSQTVIEQSNSLFNEVTRFSV